MRRRDLLISASALASAGALGLMPALSRAGQTLRTDQYFIFCYFPGAWDILLNLDPRDPRSFNETNMGSTLIQPAYGLLDAVGATQDIIPTSGVTLGPAVGELAQHGDRLAVVRGMSMDTLTHVVGMRYFLTGRTTSGQLARGSSAATWLAALLGRDEVMPNLVFGMETYNEDQEQWATGARVTSVDDLLRVLQPGDYQLSDDEWAVLDELLVRAESSEAVARSALKTRAAAARAEANTLVASQMDVFFDLAGDSEQANSLRDHFQFSRDDLDSPAAMAAGASQAITRGLSRCVSFMPSRSLDTHGSEWATDQPERQLEGWNAIARLMSDLDSKEYQSTGDSWLDHTTIVAFSEFSRSPLLNSNGGRDHSLTNACLLAGGGFRPGAYGASSDLGMEPQTVDLKTGQLDEGGELIRPENIFQTLLRHVGLEEDDARLRVDPIEAMLR